MINELKTYDSCNNVDSKGNHFCLKDKTIEDWLVKHPLEHEVNPETGCWVSDEDKCYIFTTDWDDDVKYEFFKYEAC